MPKIYITNWSDQTAEFFRETDYFTMAPGTTDYWIINDRIHLVKPSRSNGFRAKDDDRYIVFKDQNGIYRFAYIGKDGYVASNYRISNDPYVSAKDNSEKDIYFLEKDEKATVDKFSFTQEAENKTDNIAGKLIP